ncbi:MAG: DUF3738 domain-containing protein [Cyclobacteriaceae bacterium]|nr:DUF3738 domain-containing protein [Cyclobacteriaceae bacterium]
MKLPYTYALSIIIALHAITAWGQNMLPNRLRIGDDAPPLKPFKWIKGEPVAELKKGHVYIVEFGATWCAPCAAVIPELSAIAREFKSSLQVIGMFVMEHNSEPITSNAPSYLPRVENYVKKRNDKIDYSVAVDDPGKYMENTWLRASGQSGIPFTFVIDRNQKIVWMGHSISELRNVLKKVLAGTFDLEAAISQTNTIKAFPYSEIKAIAETQENAMVYISFLSQYREDEKPVGFENNIFIDNYKWAKPESQLATRQGKVQVIGESLRRLYYMAHGDTLWNYPLMRSIGSWTYPDTLQWPNQKRAYGKWWYRPVLELSDSSSFESNYRSPENRFSYYLNVPVEKGLSVIMQKRMQQDLLNSFGYNVSVETRLMPCWKLIASKETRSKLAAKHPHNEYRMYEVSNGDLQFENAEIRDIIFQLEINYGYGTNGALVHHPHLHPPFIDATGITGKIDFAYKAEYLNRMQEAREGGPKFTLDQYRELLSTFGIELIKDKIPMKVVVIRNP